MVSQGGEEQPPGLEEVGEQGWQNGQEVSQGGEDQPAGLGRVGEDGHQDGQGVCQGGEEQPPGLGEQGLQDKQDVYSLMISGFSVSADTSCLARLQSWGSSEGGSRLELGSASVSGTGSRLVRHGQVIVNLHHTELYYITIEDYFFFLS